MAPIDQAGAVAAPGSLAALEAALSDPAAPAPATEAPAAPALPVAPPAAEAPIGASIVAGAERVAGELVAEGERVLTEAEARAAKIRAILRGWIDDHFRGSIVATVTAHFNHVVKAAEDLERRLVERL